MHAHAFTRTQAPLHTSTLYPIYNSSLVKQVTNRYLRKQQREKGKHGGPAAKKTNNTHTQKKNKKTKKCLEFGSEGVHRGSVRRGREGHSNRDLIPLRGVEDGKGMETNGEKSGVRDLEAESIRSRAESTG